jgi:DNA replication and repair protein RecF
VSLGTGLDPAPGSVRDRRVVRVDGQPEKAQTVLAEHIAVVWLTPQMDGLFVDGPGARRRFLDRLVYAADPAHAGRVSAYEQAMRERARLLADYGPGADASWLDALEAAMAEKGMAVAWLDGMPSLDAEEHLRAGLAADRRTDAGDGRTRTGPHRTDLEVRHGTRKREAALCSTGEQKALLIALVLAHARMQAVERGASPVLLLDEVAAHLDRDRRAALFDLIEGLNTQAWMTGTDAALFDGMRDRAQFFHVAEGVLSAPAT